MTKVIDISLIQKSILQITEKDFFTEYEIRKALNKNSSVRPILERMVENNYLEKMIFDLKALRVDGRTINKMLESKPFKKANNEIVTNFLTRSPLDRPYKDALEELNKKQKNDYLDKPTYIAIKKGLNVMYDGRLGRITKYTIGQKGRSVLFKLRLSGKSTKLKSNLYKNTVTKDPILDAKIIECIKRADDLCTLSTGKFFGSKVKSIDRMNMPQIQDKAMPLFIETLQKKGIKISTERIEVSKLKSTQNELDGNKIRGFLKYLIEAKNDYYKKNLEEAKKRPLGWLEDPSISFIVSPIFVSRDNYVVDGHHRWASMLAYDFIDRKSLKIKMSIKRIDLLIIDILIEAKKFSEKTGLVSQSGKNVESKIEGTRILSKKEQEKLKKTKEII